MKTTCNPTQKIISNYLNTNCNGVPDHVTNIAYGTCINTGGNEICEPTFTDKGAVTLVYDGADCNSRYKQVVIYKTNTCIQTFSDTGN